MSAILRIRSVREMRRMWWLWRARSVGASIGTDPKLNRRTRLTSRTRVGANFNSNGLAVHGRGKLTVGDNFHCGTGCVVLTDTHNYQGESIPYDQTFVVADTIIGDNVWLGINVTILPGVRIGEGAIIQAGSVVVNDISDLSIAGGHPARVFSQRDPAHYHPLRRAGKVF